MTRYPETKLGIFTRVYHDLKLDGKNICDLPEKLQTDKRVILLALPTYDDAIKYVKDEHLEDDAFVEEAYKANREAFWQLGSRLQVIDEVFKYILLLDEKNFLRFIKKMEILNLDSSNSKCQWIAKGNLGSFELSEYCKEKGTSLENLKNIIQLFELNKHCMGSKLLLCAEYFKSKECLDYILNTLSLCSFENLEPWDIYFERIDLLMEFFKTHSTTLEEFTSIFIQWCMLPLFKEIQETERTEIIKRVISFLSSRPDLVNQVSSIVSSKIQNDEIHYLTLFKEYVGNENCPNLNNWYERVLRKLKKDVNLLESFLVQ